MRRRDGWSCDRTYERLWTEQVRNRKTVSVDAPARLLRLLVLISSRAEWSADDLAERLDVTTRTVRRDVTRLRSLGYPVESTTGPYGGYALGSGGRLPPLLFDDDEAVAAMAGLRSQMEGADAALAAAAMSALTKFAQVLPRSLRDRMTTLAEVSDGLSRRRGSADVGQSATHERAGVTVLMDVAVSCRRNERARFDYRSGADVETRRHAEPFRLVSVGHRWYLVAFDLDRDDWRTFRVDRITRWVATGVRSSDRERPDATALVAEGIAVRAFEMQARVRVHLPRTEVERIVAPNVAVVEPRGTTAAATMIRIGGPIDWVAGYLIGLPCAFDVVDPDDLRVEVVRQADVILERHARDRDGG